jgi:hypothetical protein
MLSRLHFQRKLMQTLEALRNGIGSGVEFEQQRFLHRELLALVLHLRCELLPPESRQGKSDQGAGGREAEGVVCEIIVQERTSLSFECRYR